MSYHNSQEGDHGVCTFDYILINTEKKSSDKNFKWTVDRLIAIEKAYCSFDHLFIYNYF